MRTQPRVAVIMVMRTMAMMVAMMVAMIVPVMSMVMGVMHRGIRAQGMGHCVHYVTL